MKQRKSTPPQQAQQTFQTEQRLEQIGDSLRKKYDDIREERIPDRLQRLIDALKEAERNTKKVD